MADVFYRLGKMRTRKGRKKQEMADKKWLENAELLQHRMNPTPENPETCSSRFEAPHQKRIYFSCSL
jgi:hypothetical protein